jgi:hypothetical protein
MLAVEEFAGEARNKRQRHNEKGDGIPGSPAEGSEEPKKGI